MTTNAGCCGDMLSTPSPHAMCMNFNLLGCHPGCRWTTTCPAWRSPAHRQQHHRCRSASPCAISRRRGARARGSSGEPRPMRAERARNHKVDRCRLSHAPSLQWLSRRRRRLGAHVRARKEASFDTYPHRQPSSADSFPNALPGQLSGATLCIFCFAPRLAVHLVLSWSCSKHATDRDCWRASRMRIMHSVRSTPAQANHHADSRPVLRGGGGGGCHASKYCRGGPGAHPPDADGPRQTMFESCECIFQVDFNYTSGLPPFHGLLCQKAHGHNQRLGFSTLYKAFGVKSFGLSGRHISFKERSRHQSH